VKCVNVPTISYRVRIMTYRFGFCSVLYGVGFRFLAKPGFWFGWNRRKNS